LTKNLKKTAIPGDSLAVPEEFLPGRNVYESDGSIRSLLVGNVVRDLKGMEIGVEPLVSRRTPLVGDYVTGQVESVQSSSANMKIYYLNGKQTLGGFSGTIFLRSERFGRDERRTQLKLGDIVRGKVVSTLNAIIQLSINDRHCGVIFSLCSNCGRPVSRADSRGRCLECGSVEDRKFADDFGREPLEP
jgi:exosome complex RNA-binding protein Csl4